MQLFENQPKNFWERFYIEGDGVTVTRIWDMWVTYVSIVSLNRARMGAIIIQIQGWQNISQTWNFTWTVFSIVSLCARLFYFTSRLIFHRKLPFTMKKVPAMSLIICEWQNQAHDLSDDFTDLMSKIFGTCAFYFWIKIRILEGNFWIEKSQFWLWEIHKRTSALNTDCNRCWFSRYLFTSTTIIPIVSLYKEMGFEGSDFWGSGQCMGLDSILDSFSIISSLKSKVCNNHNIWWWKC